MPLSEVEVNHDRSIEDYEGPCLQVDFANRFIGGGTLGYGNVQEELMFAVSPELIASMAFTEEMDDNEAIVMVGAEHISLFTGYERASHAGRKHDNRPIDEHNRLDSHVVAIDALELMGMEANQYKDWEIARELNKAFIGFTGDSADPTPLRPVVTGKWGCGVFRGDPQLKFMIQWAAASRVGRKMVFMTFRDHSLRDIEEVVRVCKATTMSVGQLVAALQTVRTNRIFESFLRQS
jgi:poly(ADP-ribose) glycohydrolase